MYTSKTLWHRQLSSATISTLLIILALSTASAQITADIAADPARAVIVYDDVRNFAQALRLLNSGGDPVVVLKTAYFDRASSGLRAYIKELGLTPENLAAAVRRRPDEYASLSDLPDRLAALDGVIRQKYTELKALVPDAVFLATYYVIGEGRNYSEASEYGIFVSVENFSAAHVVPMVIHEQAHVQQATMQGLEKYQALYGTERSLLGLAIREGGADFIANLITGSHTHTRAHAYVLKNERELWKRFSMEMNGRESGDWMWKEPSDPNQPRDVGYSIGFQIVNAFYSRAQDKNQAIKEILAATDYAAFLMQSGYAERF